MSTATDAPRRASRRRSRREQGYILVWTALLLVVLMLMAAFSVDLGSFYSRASQVQRAADAAALAGVVHLPDDIPKAKQAAIDAAKKNGFDDPDPARNPTKDIDVYVETRSDGNLSLRERQLRVEIFDRSVDTVFWSVVGPDSISITRTSRAEFSQPLSLGSPENHLGIGTLFPPRFGDSADGSWFRQFYWLAVNGWCTPAEEGDSVLSQFDGSGLNCGPSFSPRDDNPDYDPKGYYYSVDIPDARSQPMVIQVYDPSYWPDHQPCLGPGNLGLLALPPISFTPPARSPGLQTCDTNAYANNVSGYRTTWQDSSATNGSGSPGFDQRLTASIDKPFRSTTGRMTTTYQVLAPDTNEVPDDNPPYAPAVSYTGGMQIGNESCGDPRFDFYRYGSDCLTDIGSAYLDDFVASTTSPVSGRNTFRYWDTIASIPTTAPGGRYYVNVKTLAGEADSWGTNAFALRAVYTSGSQAYRRCDSRKVPSCPQVSGSETMSILAASPDDAAIFNLADVPVTEAGKTLQVEMWDPGDGGDTIGFYYPDNTNPIGKSDSAVAAIGAHPMVWQDVTTYYDGTSLPPGLLAGGGAPQTEADNLLKVDAVGPSRPGRPGSEQFNDHLVRVFLPIPTDYKAGASDPFGRGGWWLIRYDFGSGGVVNDRTTWTVRVLGDPVHLIPDV